MRIKPALLTPIGTGVLVLQQLLAFGWIAFACWLQYLLFCIRTDL